MAKKLYLKPGYHGTRGKMGKQRIAKIVLRTDLSDGCSVALVHFQGKEPPRWVYEKDIILERTEEKDNEPR